MPLAPFFETQSFYVISFLIGESKGAKYGFRKPLTLGVQTSRQTRIADRQSIWPNRLPTAWLYKQQDRVSRYPNRLLGQTFYMARMTV